MIRGPRARRCRNTRQRLADIGYALNDGKLSIHQDEAKTVRLIFERYLELGSVNRLVTDLRAKGLTSKVRKLSSGAIRGGVAFTQSPLFYMLRNRFYIGEMTFKGDVLPGPQPPLLERSLFEAVQIKLTEQWSHRTRARQKSKALLSGLLFDDAGNRMIPTHATRNRVRYRYYISEPQRRGHSDAPVGSISRVPADQIEALVTKAVRDRLMESDDRSQSLSEQNGVAAYVAKVEVRAQHLVVTIRAIEPTPNHDDAGTMLDQGELILMPWTKPPMRKFRDVIQPASASTQRTRPIRAERRAGLIRAIARGRQWLEEIVSGRLTVYQARIARALGMFLGTPGEHSNVGRYHFRLAC